MEDYLLPTAAAFALLLFVYTFRNGITDIFYLATTHWKHTVFIAVCIGTGLCIGIFEARPDGAMRNYNFHFSLPRQTPAESERLAAQISQCMKFVEAKMDGRYVPDVSESSPRDRIFTVGVQSHWDSCAVAFGQSYWKHDTFIRGREAGIAFCEAYRNGTYRSGNVESWCATVLAPGKRI
jgi:hypothetical protein